MFFLFGAFGRDFRLLVLYLTIITSIYSEISVAPCYVPSSYLIMPVTTRLQAKRSLGHCEDHLITSSLGSFTSLPTSTMPTCNISTTTSSTIDTSLLSVQASEINSSNLCSTSSSSLISSMPLPISNFHNFEISNNINFDPGIPHNSSVSKLINMEVDCQDNDDTKMASSIKLEDPPDLNKFLSVLRAHITASTSKMSNEFQQVASANNSFKQEIRNANNASQQEVRDDILELRALLYQQRSNVQVPASSMSSMNSILPQTSPDTIVKTTSVAIPSSISPTVASTDDVLRLLTESFSKMVIAMSEKYMDSKVEWPTFSGDSKKFRSWYLAIMTQLAIAPWKELYDSSRNDVISMTMNAILNEKLYSKLILSLEGNALQHVVSRKHLQGQGIMVLQDLVHVYKPKNIPEVIAAKTTEFWGSLKQAPAESVDAYYNRSQEQMNPYPPRVP
jgi:DNA uptake protein ComE-like DNA-binding protein